MSYEIYWGAGNPYSWCVLLGLEIKRLKYKSRLLEFSKLEHRSPEILEMIRDITVSTRTDPRCILGCSPRGSESLLLSGKSRAAIHGRDFVIPDDVILMIPHIVHHRLILKPEAELEGITQIRISEDIRDSLTIPVDPVEEEMVYEEYIEDITDED